MLMDKDRCSENFKDSSARYDCRANFELMLNKSVFDFLYKTTNNRDTSVLNLHVFHVRKAVFMCMKFLNQIDSNLPKFL